MCSSEVAPVPPGPSPLLAGDFATLQRLLSDSFGSDARDPPANLSLQDFKQRQGEAMDSLAMFDAHAGQYIETNIEHT